METHSPTGNSIRASKLVVVEDPIPGKTAGGVQLLARTLAGQEIPDTEVVLVAPDKVLGEIENATKDVRVIVYVQKSGSLSPEFAKLAQAWLAGGARVVEKNVFARASRFRPTHPNYHMALMSEDGAYRFVLRSLFVPNNLRGGYLYLPVPTFDTSPKTPTTEVGARDELTLLRIGRPDPIKWSEFEHAFASNLARSTDRKVRLIRVGYPGSMGVKRVVQEDNLTIEDIPYLKETSSLYACADIYLHHSRIGETFGNTLAEAKSAGLPVIMAADLYWDCAGAELLSKHLDVIGEPAYLISKANRAVEKALTNHRTADKVPHDQLSPSAFVKLLTADTIAGDRLRSFPGLWESISYFWRLRSSVDGANLLSFTRAVVTEPIRSVHHARQLDS